MNLLGVFDGDDCMLGRQVATAVGEGVMASITAFLTLRRKL